MNEQHISLISSELKVKPSQVAATIELLDGGNTLPGGDGRGLGAIGQHVVLG